ncbi:MAG: hypothetical protein U0W65_06500 [Bacteroidia bacterium]
MRQSDNLIIRQFEKSLFEKSLSVICLLILLFVLQNCAPTRFVKPLAKNQNAISANLGGPLIHFGNAVTPIPFTSFMYGRGITNSTTAFASVHTTAMLYGNFQTDIGVCQRLYKHDSLGFGLTINPAVNMVYDKWNKNFRTWPQLDVNIYKDILKNKAFVYIGLTNWFELSAKKAHSETQKNHALINPHIGMTYNTKKWGYTLECKFLQMNKNNKPNVVDYVGIQQKGAVGIYLNFSRRF